MTSWGPIGLEIILPEAKNVLVNFNTILVKLKINLKITGQKPLQNIKRSFLSFVVIFDSVTNRKEKTCFRVFWCFECKFDEIFG